MCANKICRLLCSVMPLRGIAYFYWIKQALQGKWLLRQYSLSLLFACLLSSCAYNDVPKSNNFKQPMTAEPIPPSPPVIDGSIFQPGQAMNYGYQPMFEDRHPRNIGDTLTILLDENVSATKSSSINTSRGGDSGLSFLLGPTTQNLKLNGSNDFNGKGGAAAKNTFTGTITVTVNKVLANGNLSVVGEKQIAINEGTEYIRFSGIVNPSTISGNNTVMSTQVADARIEYVGNGYTNQGQQMGWLQRLWLTISPF